MRPPSSASLDRALGRTLERARRAVSDAAASLDRRAMRWAEADLQRRRRGRPRAGAAARERALEVADAYCADTLALPSRFFPTPEPAALTVVERSRGPGGCRVYDLSQPSTYQPFWAPARDSYLSFRDNLTSHARWWRGPVTAAGPRPVIVAVHGWRAGAHWISERMFAIPYWLRHGFDVIAFQLPFHGLRTPAEHRSGALFPSFDLARTNEAFGHAIYDLRALSQVLRQQYGVAALGALGMSLGSYVSALWATISDELAFAIATVPAVSMPSLMLRDGGEAALARRARADGIDEELLHQAFAVHSPLRRPVRVPRDRLFVIGGHGDRITPAEQAHALIAHWRCASHWFVGGHLAQIGRHQALRAARLQLQCHGLGEE